MHLLNKIITEKNLTKLLKKRENQSSEAPRTTGKSKYSNYFAVREFSCTPTFDTEPNKNLSYVPTVEKKTKKLPIFTKNVGNFCIRIYFFITLQTKTICNRVYRRDCTSASLRLNTFAKNAFITSLFCLYSHHIKPATINTLTTTSTGIHHANTSLR